MQDKTKRIERLESKNGPAHTVGAVIWKVMQLSQNGSQPTGEAIAWILGGNKAGRQMEKELDETWEQFEARVEAAQ